MLNSKMELKKYVKIYRSLNCRVKERNRSALGGLKSVSSSTDKSLGSPTDKSLGNSTEEMATIERTQMSRGRNHSDMGCAKVLCSSLCSLFLSSK